MERDIVGQGAIDMTGSDMRSSRLRPLMRSATYWAGASSLRICRCSVLLNTVCRKWCRPDISLSHLVHAARLLMLTVPSPSPFVRVALALAVKFEA